MGEKKTYKAKMAMVDKKERTPVKTKNWASEAKSPGGSMVLVDGS